MLNKITNPLSYLKTAPNKFFFALFNLPFVYNLGIIFIIIFLFQQWIKEYHQIVTKIESKLLLLLSIFFIISSIFAENSLDSWLGLANFLPFFALFLATQSLIKTPKQLTISAFLLSVTSIFIVSIGLGQLFVNWHIAGLFRSIIGWRIILNGSPPERMSAIFIHANLLSLFLCTSLTFCTGLLIANQPRFKINISKNKSFYKIKQQLLNIVNNYRNIRYFLILTILFDLIGIYLTNSRVGWIITIFILISFSIYCHWYKILQLITLMGIIVGWASFGNLPGQSIMRQIVPSSIWLRLSDQMFPDRPLETLRITQWQFAMEMTGDRPLWGWGLRNFDYLYHQTYDIYIGHPHNLFLMLGAETGLIGLILTCIFVGLIIIKTIKSLTIIKHNKKDAIILFTYLISFGNYLLFNLPDSSIFDLRLNLIGWIILGSMAGVSNQINHGSYNLRSQDEFVQDDDD
ncbi:O-antigen ligase family protein [Cyanobacterium stanieri LEGE 03274]|uniref:O-antigen ligase family protein n=1 Tax=Cyanobacterium stanieri LEGE 03274 TaxID=1828756 RepID=A0ABR9V875_9CHRO|nr:O-antigen ligase family protein [Cyanobacterium stanieri]MBE9223749.1 O-antigen ligase family protein [Cyanobacterium stanieri LEGE 03274]